jgi:hypothetical protein
MTLRLSAAEAAVLADGSAERLLDAEQRHGGQAAALAAQPELVPVGQQVQRIRAKIAADRLGLEGFELSGDAVPLRPDVIAEASRIFQAIVASEDHADALVELAADAGSSRGRDDDVVEDRP